MADEQGGLNVTPQEQDFNSDVMLNHVRFNDVDGYISEAQRRGVLPADLSEEQKASIKATFERAKSGK